MLAFSRGVRTASTSLRISPALTRRVCGAQSLRLPAITGKTEKETGIDCRRAFKTMAPVQAGAPTVVQAREYDSEITDIASYVHHTSVESDLAVGFAEGGMGEPWLM